MFSFRHVCILSPRMPTSQWDHQLVSPLPLLAYESQPVPNEHVDRG